MRLGFDKDEVEWVALRDVAIDGVGMGKENCSIVRIVLIVRLIERDRAGKIRCREKV